MDKGKAEDNAEAGSGKIPLQRLVIRFLVPLFDSIILWCYGWEKTTDAYPGMTHYVDPETGNYWLKEAAVNICENRMRNT